MKDKCKIIIARKIIQNLQDYIELVKAEKKLKIENVEQQINNVTDFIKNNVKEL